MKNKSWIIILIMGIALTISIAYSIVVSQRKNLGESTVTTTSIVEMTATTVTIKNTLTGTGKIEYKEKDKEISNNTTNATINDIGSGSIASEENHIAENQNTENIHQEENKIYQITLSVEDKDLNKVKVNQDAEILIKKENENLNYIGKVININKNANNKSTLNIEILYPDENIKEELSANCTVIVEKADNVVALPIEAIQKNEDGKEFVDVVQIDGTTKSTLIKTGISDDYYVEITSGLKVGDRVQIVKSSTTIVNPNVTSEE